MLLISCGISKKSQEIPIVAKEGAIEIDGFILKYIRKGKGEPVVIVGSSEYYSKSFSANLEKKYDLIFVDSRHFVADCNPSKEELGKINLSTFSSDLETIRKHLNLDKIGLIGHSVHAQIALDYAINYPDKLNKLILIGGVPYNMSEIGEMQENLWNLEASQERKSILAENNKTLQSIIDTTSEDRKFAISYHYNAPLYWANPRYDASRLLDGLRTCPKVLGKLFRSIPSKNAIIEKLNRISVPTLLVLGKIDFVIPYKSWEEILGHNPQIKYILMENAGHNPHTEESTQADFDRYLLRWISGLK